MQSRVPIPGSEVHLPNGGSWLPADSNQPVRATIVLRRSIDTLNTAQQLLSGSWHPATRDEALSRMRADPADLAAVYAFLRSYGLAVVGENAEARTVQVSASIAQMSRAFGVEIAMRTEDDGHRYLSYEGPLTVPAGLSEIVTAVLGLDQRPVARRGAS